MFNWSFRAQGSIFVTYYMKAMGATVGKDPCLFFGCGVLAKPPLMLTDPLHSLHCDSLSTYFSEWVCNRSLVIGVSSGLEFDLLQLGDFVSIGDECDITCHTVENMVRTT